MKWPYLLLLGGLLTVFLIGFFLTLALRLWFWLMSAVFALATTLILGGAIILLALWIWRRIRG